MVTANRSDAGLRSRALDLLERHWDHERGFCVPNPATYLHLWLWDSCFHAIVWSHLGDARAAVELASVLDGQLPEGLVPHMRYGPACPDTWLGPLASTSSLAQPPMFGHAVKVLAAHSIVASPRTITRAKRGLAWLWSHRRTDLDLMYIVHPWEAGNDHSPRWDGWAGAAKASHDRSARTAWNKARMGDVTFHRDGAAAWSTSFVACPAAFNAYVAYNMVELAEVLDDPVLAERGQRIAAAMDLQLWDAEQLLWADLAVVGGQGTRATTPISDGVMGALVTADGGRAEAAMGQLRMPHRFGAPYGPTNVARSDPAYEAGTYWRGAAWPQLNYLLWLGLRRWQQFDEASALAEQTREGVWRSGWAEYWNPETGHGLGAVPQSWTGLVVAMTADD